MSEETPSNNTPDNAPAPTGSQPGNAAPPADTGVPATPPAADASAETDQQGEGEGDQPKPKHRGGFQKRIGELTAKNRELERRLAEVSAPKGAGQGDADAPKRENFASYEDYIEARAAHTAKQTFADLERARAEKAVADARDERLSTFGAEMSSDAAADPTFQKAWATVTAQGFPVSEAMFEFVSESDDPHSVIEWLAENRAEAAKLYHASPAQVARALARVEAKQAAAPPARTPQAPPPPPTLNGRSTPRVDLVKLAGNKNAGDYIAKRRAEMAKAS